MVMACMIMVVATRHPAFANEPMLIPVDQVELIITTSTGSISYDVEIADTDQERAAGLMHRTELPNNRAMLFDFQQTRMVSMWMKNTPLPLDMLFIDESGTVVSVATNTKPQSLDVISSQRPVRFVLEVNAGQVELHGIKPGDKLSHPLFKR